MSYEPKGTRFYDCRSKREMMLVLDGPYSGWLAYKHPDGQWVTLRIASEDDRTAISKAVIEAHHAD